MFLNGEEVDRMGEMEICPPETTTYHLMVDTPEGPWNRVLSLHRLRGRNSSRNRQVVCTLTSCPPICTPTVSLKV